MESETNQKNISINRIVQKKLSTVKIQTCFPGSAYRINSLIFSARVQTQFNFHSVVRILQTQNVRQLPTYPEESYQ
jgi:hypothetical protein